MRYCDLRNSLMKMKNFKLLLSPLLFLVLSGCDGSFIFSDVRKVTIAMDTPDLLEKPWFSVTYRSHKCQRTRRDGDFKKHYEDDSSVTTYEPEREKNSNIYSVTMPVEKGWYCDWKLSNVEFKLKYKKGNKFYDGKQDSAFKRIIFRFDDHQPGATNGLSDSRYGRREVINEDIYPFKIEHHIVGDFNELRFTGRSFFYTYNFERDVEYIIFKPTIHFNEVVTWIDPLRWGHGEQVKLLYPDGSVDFGETEPDFERLQKIRRERQQTSN